MTDTLAHAIHDAEEPATRQDRDAQELDGDCMPVLAGQFHITDLQHWLDLCA
jgi:hypothetical protein